MLNIHNHRQVLQHLIYHYSYNIAKYIILVKINITIIFYNHTQFFKYQTVIISIYDLFSYIKKLPYSTQIVINLLSPLLHRLYSEQMCP